ncbi:PEGA domain-containing protein, partial [candidate division TA06 bacterium]|nr:PEGA domain-containing protein [candidate division TA06 bacterium]
MQNKMRIVMMAAIMALAIVLPVQAQKLTVSVTDLKITSGLSEAEGEQLTKKLLNELAAIKAYEVLDIAQRDYILKEQGFQQTGACDQSSCLVEVGQLLGVQKMIGGSIGKVSGVYSVELQMVDVKTSRLDMPFSRSYADGSKLLGAMKEAAAEFSKWKPTAVAQAIAPLSVDYGGLVIRSTPPGAKIFLDGADVGTTPGQLSKIEAGEHQVIIAKDGYSSFSKTVTVAKNITTTVSAVLTKEYGSLSITSEPANASVFIDGVSKGLTGSTGLSVSGLGIGAHKIKVTKAGYQAYEVEMTIESGDGNSLNAQLTPKPGSIVITSTPGGASVTVDGTPRGNTPCSVTGLEPGTYSVKVEKTGYQDGEISVNIGAGQSVAKAVVLRTQPQPLPSREGAKGLGRGEGRGEAD